jgi:hypothetical protein
VAVSWLANMSAINVHAEEGDAYTVDETELKVKVLDMVAMVISFGEYLQQSNREDYIERFIDHIVDGASGEYATHYLSAFRTFS